jgi:Lon protease-like protein
LFPGGRLALRIFEQRYMEMAKTCLRDGAPFGVCLIREGAEVGAAATPMEVGTLAKITTWDMPQLGVLQVSALGERRFRILERRVEPNGLARARVELLAPEPDSQAPGSLAFCARLAERLPLPLELLQELLELDDAPARFARVNALLANAQEAS